ncbi:related to deacetylase [Melanopsichium pennsylvanicum]|uniref:Related to deacetylase n=2 Tax=Melanopsichium pennsylvanicum TaxID=63383 RepID=A0AAJ4XRW3_9BASI|nr:family 4 carbohydrate esterase [Melanopsichium pennsylvanicum 4]SNX87394.1 related to deacetylase [Melanopsichium pennsylvanicum]
MQPLYLLAACITVSMALLRHVNGAPSVLDTTNDHISANVRRELSTLSPSEYTLYERSVGHTMHSPIKRDEIIKGLQKKCHKERVLGLTFDDGPYIWHRELLRTLKEGGDQMATFFVNGNNYRCIYDKDSVRRLRQTLKHGHLICSHTWSHTDITTLTNEELDKQIQLLNEALWKTVGVIPACFRPPYGNIRPDQVKYLNDKWGLTVVTWSEDTGDANGDGVKAGLDVYRHLKAPQCAIILNHETVEATVKTVIPKALNIIRKKGYVRSYSVDDLLGFHAYKKMGVPQQRDETWTCDGKPQPGGK